MIKRGVSLYSYQQAQFLKQMNLRDMLRELHDMGCTGVEIISQQTIPHYPTPSDQFVAEWHEMLEEYQLTAVTMDLYNDVLQFRDHVMSHQEVSELFMRDIALAAKLGFQNVRCCLGVPVDIMIGALPAAEEYNVRIGREIHHPYRFEDSFVDEILEHVAKTGTKHLGLIPDMSMFQTAMPRAQWENMVRVQHVPEDVMACIVALNKAQVEETELCAEVERRFPGVELPPMLLHHMAVSRPGHPERMAEMAPYIVSIHGKCIEMSEAPDQPGGYADLEIDYRTPFHYLKQAGWDGWCNTEYEGQRFFQDLPLDQWADDVEQVRRHQKMMKALIEDA